MRLAAPLNARSTRRTTTSACFRSSTRGPRRTIRPRLRRAILRWVVINAATVDPAVDPSAIVSDVEAELRKRGALAP